MDIISVNDTAEILLKEVVKAFIDHAHQPDGMYAKTFTKFRGIDLDTVMLSNLISIGKLINDYNRMIDDYEDLCGAYRHLPTMYTNSRLDCLLEPVRDQARNDLEDFRFKSRLNLDLILCWYYGGDPLLFKLVN